MSSQWKLKMSLWGNLRMMYVVNCSGGLSSFEALHRCLDRYGKGQTHAIFADTLQEDEDLYRFLADQERYFGISIERVCDGRTIWQTMKDRRCITLRAKNGSEIAPCSLELKRLVIDRTLASRYKDEPYTLVFGYDWLETHRAERLERELAPQAVWFPLLDKPLKDKCEIAASLDKLKIAVPRLYTLGFEHNNCGGGCIRAGLSHFAHLYFTLPERYAEWERKEQEIRDFLGKDVTILKDRRGGVTKPLTLRAFRERLEAGDRHYLREHDGGGCGCFA
jgi:hypothetical protein